jgi:hypothetical protein
MADKRISQLIERTDIANNDVLPIVASGATTTNKVTVSTLQDWMQDNLDVGVTSVGLSVPSAFTVSGSPVTTSGNITISGAGTTAQYIRGDGSLADFPSISGGGSSVSYYLNGSVSQGTIGGVAYLEMNKVPILGAGTDITINADGYIASFITDAGDPSLLEIPGGNWNFETYFQASSGGGSPTFYVELYKVNSGGTATLIASNSTSPESISLGTAINPYFSVLAVPTTTLALTDRLAIRYYVVHAGRTITLHTENNTLCQIITTFTTGLTALNGLTAQVQNFATGTSGTDFNISSSSTTHTFNLPDASASNRGVVTTGTQTFAGAKTFSGGINSISAVLTGALNGVNASFTSTISSQDRISTDTIFSVKHNSTVFTLNGYNSIQGNLNSFAVYNGTKGMRINFPSDESYTHTLPDASGTLALTSNLSAYLPLAGGTLTGALNGTSAVFSGDVQSGTRLIAAASSQSILLTPNSGGSTNRVESVGTLPLALVSAAAITMAAGGTTPQITLATTGAATFSNTLAVTGQAAFGTSVNTTHDVLIQGTTSNNTKNAFRIQNSSAASLFAVRNDGVIDLYNNTTVGGTLGVTGALNGTNASFSGKLSVTQASTDFVAEIVNTQNATPYGLRIKDAASGANGYPLLSVSNNSGSVEYFRVNSGTGTATFSSSVTATSFSNAGLQSGEVFNATKSNAGYFVGYFQNTSATGLGLYIQNGNDNNDALRIGNAAGTANNIQLYGSGKAYFAGNVGIGTASPDIFGRGDTQNVGISVAGASDNMALQLNAGGSAGRGAQIYMGQGGTRHFTISSNVSESRAGTTSNTPLVIETNSTERMRITSGGELLINATSNSATSDDGSKFVSNGRLFQVSSYSDNTQESLSMYSTTASAYRFYVGWGGTIFATNTTISGISDIRVKENIRDLDAGLDKIMALKPRLFDWKEGKGKDIKNDRGFIAQEFEEVFPDLIDEYKQELEEGEEPYKSVRADLIPVLVKAIQELKTEIDSLKNQIK